MQAYHSASGSMAEDLFIRLFSEAFGAEKAGYLYSQYHFYDIYQNSCYADFMLENQGHRVAIEIDDEGSHHKNLVASGKFYDDLLKQNSMVYLGWDVYRWTVRQMQLQPETVRDELRVFLGSHPRFREIEDYLPTQRGKALDRAELELKEHQLTALKSLEEMRSRGETIALLYHATGTGKTVTAVMDAKRCGGRAPFLAHTQELVGQAAETFQTLWPGVTVGRYMETVKESDAHVVCGSVQSVALHLDCFREDAFDYLIVDGAHHAVADTYKKILAFFHPAFTLGLTATPERNRLIVDTWLRYIQKKRTVVFCASVWHTEEIAELFRQADVSAAAVSGGMKQSEQKEFQDRFIRREIQVLCASDLLNEGWDCPEIEVLFMARPTMSRVLYTQQLGRGMRLYQGKESLMVFDFVDNASQYNLPMSLHRLFKPRRYRAGELVLSPWDKRMAENALYDRREKPAALLDWPVDATDYELVDLFDWQEEARGMSSQMEFVRRMNVQAETIERYVREGKLIPNLAVPMSEHRTFKYFKEETVQAYAQRYGWMLIDDRNRKDLFMEMVRRMDMSYSYKPVLVQAILRHADEKGRVKLSGISDYFHTYYERRRAAGLVVEKPGSIFANGGYTDSEAQRNILANPFKRFEDMQILRHTRTLGIIQVDEAVWKRLTEEEKAEIGQICEEKLEAYYQWFRGFPLFS